MSSLDDLKLATIDDALTECEPCLEEFAYAHGFALTRSHNESFNIPRRWLRRETDGIHHEVGLIIALHMPERLARGFYPDIPCILYIAAFDRTTQKHYHADICEAQPFVLFRDSLRHHLADALAKLDACSAAYISQYGVDEHLN